MATFKPYEPQNEKELHSIIEKELDSLEDGLSLLKYEMPVGRGIPDFLCVDSGGRLVIIEVKVHEDENILFQALRYYADINKSRYVIANIFSQNDINPNLFPRVVLIAKRFSEDIRLLGTFVNIDVELYEYSTVMDSAEARGIVYHPISLYKVEESVVEPSKMEDHKGYITNDDLKPIFDKVREDIKNIHSDIEEYVTQSYIGYKYNGRVLSWVAAQRKSFDVGVNIINDKGEAINSDSVRIKTENDAYTEIIDKIKESFTSLGGHLTSTQKG